MVQPFATGGGESPRPHVLIVALDFSGHYFPMIQLLYHLARFDGLTVTVVCNKRRIQELTDLQSSGDFGNLDLRLKEVLRNITPLPGTNSFDQVSQTYRLWKEDLELFARKLAEEKNLPGGPTALVVDFSIYWLDDLANELGIPWYSFYSICPAYGLAAFHAPTLVAEGWHPYDSPTPKRDLDVTTPGLEFCRGRDLLSDIWDHPEFYMKQSEQMSKAAALIFNTAENVDAFAGSLNALRASLLHRRTGEKSLPLVLAIGPIINYPGFMTPTNKKDTLQRDSCLEFLDSQAPSSVLYVAFGSIAELSAKMVVELALGLEASGVPFLWVFGRRQQEEGGSELLPSGFEERTRGRGILEKRWVPQTQILAHPSTGGFLSHCGWNSTLESMCLGVPVITCPVDYDQGLNARFLEFVAKVSIPLRNVQEDFTREEVEKAVKLLMVKEKGKEKRTHAMEMKRLFEETMAEGGSSHQAFEWLMNELLKVPKWKAQDLA